MEGGSCCGQCLRRKEEEKGHAIGWWLKGGNQTNDIVNYKAFQGVCVCVCGEGGQRGTLCGVEVNSIRDSSRAD